MAHGGIPFMKISDALLSGKIELWEIGTDSDCLTGLNLSRDKELIREMEWEMFCMRNDSCCSKEEKRGVVYNIPVFSNISLG